MMLNRISKLLLFWLILLVLIKPSSLYGAGVVIAPGDSGYSNQRHLIVDPWGHYWAFFNSGGTFMWYFSSDGSNWATSGEVFDDVSDDSGYGSVWYVESSTRVYFTIPQTGSVPNDIYARYGTLNENGSITWESSSVLVETASGDKITGIHGSAKPSITRSSDNKIWLLFSGDKDKGGAWEDKPMAGFQRGNASLGGWLSNSVQSGNEAKDGIAEDLAVVPYDNAGSVMASYNNSDDGKWYLWPCDNKPDWGANDSPDNVYSYTSEDYYAALIPDPDLSAATVHIAYVDGNGYLRYNKYVSGSSNLYTVSSSSAVWKNVTIGMAGDTSGSDIYIAATDGNGTLRVFKAVSPYTTWNELLQNKWPPVNASYASLPVYGNPIPYPLPIIYYDETTGKVTFNRIVTSTFPAPALSYLEDPQGRTSPASAGQTASLRTVDAYGSGFQDWGPMSASMGAGISVSSVTYSSQTHCQITFSVSQSAGGGYRNVSISNPDGQSSNVLSSSFTITEPLSSIDTVTPALINIEGEYWSEGITSFDGTSNLNAPPSPAQLTNTLIKIIRDDNWFWNGSGFQDPTGIEEDDKYVSTSDTSPWNYTNADWPDSMQEEGRGYTVKSRATSDDGGKGADSAAKTFTIDKSVDVSPVITVPQGWTCYKPADITSIYGNFQDNGIGIDSGTIRIAEDVGMDDNDSNDVYYQWFGSSWSWGSSEAWFDVPNSPWPSPDALKNWSMTSATDPPMPSWENGKKYRVRTKGYDALDHKKMSILEPDFIYDTSRPTVTLSVPALPDGQYYSSMDEITGTIPDNVVHIMNEKKVYVRVSGAGSFWYNDGGTWISTTTAYYNEVTVAGTLTNWTLDTYIDADNKVDWQDGVTYTVEVYAEDNAGNAHGTSGSPEITRTFKYDETPPSSEIVTPQDETYLNLAPDTTGYASDVVYYNQTKVCLKDLDVTKYYKQGNDPPWIAGVQWNVVDSFSTGPGDHDWEYLASSVTWIDGRKCIVWTRAFDAAGNEETSPTDSDITLADWSSPYGGERFQVDFTTPEAIVTYPVDGQNYNTALSGPWGHSIEGTCHTSINGDPVLGSNFTDNPDPEVNPVL